MCAISRAEGGRNVPPSRGSRTPSSNARFSNLSECEEHILITLSKVQKRYRRGQEPVLADVELDVPAGRLVQVRGENGSGKSTLLRIAAGFVRPTAGRVCRSFESLGFVPDKSDMLSMLTARSYLASLARIRGLKSSVARSRIDELQDLFVVRPGLDERAAAMSKGNRKKVLLMQAFVFPTDMVIMDEPVTALDAATIGSLRHLITASLDRGCGFLVASHGDDLDDLGTSYMLRSGSLRPTDSKPAPTLNPRNALVRLGGSTSILEHVSNMTGITPTIILGPVAEFSTDTGTLPRLLRAALDAGCEIIAVCTGEA